MKTTKESTTWRVFAILLLCFLFWGSFNVHAAKKPWAKYSNGTLTFYFSEKSSLGSDEYDMNTGNRNPGWDEKRNAITKVVFNASFADARPTTCYRWFCNQVKLTTIEGLTYLNTSQVTNMDEMFRECSILTSLDLSNFDTSNVTGMFTMFLNCSKLETIYASEKFKVDKVTNGQEMFFGCFSLKGNIAYGLNQGGSEYANLEGYFTDKSLPDRPWAEYADNNLYFHYGYKYKSAANEYFLNDGYNEPGWITEHKGDIQKVTFDETFKNARPTSCTSWFSGCVNLTNIYNISNLNTSSMVYTTAMFRDCKKLYTLDLSSFDTSKVWDFDYMFSGCTSLNSINVSSFDTSHAMYLCGIFKDCSNLTSINISNFVLGSNASNISYMFAGCTKLQTIDISNFSLANIKSIYSLFDGCTELSTIKFCDLSSLTNATSLSGIFNGCSRLTSLDLTTLSTENIKDMSYMFKGCTKLQSVYVSDKFVTSAVTSSHYMFDGCVSLSGSIDFDASKPVDKTYASADGYFINRDYIRPWVKYENGTLTFKYRSKKNFANNEYALNSNETAPKWVGNNANVIKVVFEAPFANVRPTSCYRWFHGCSKLTQDSIIGLSNLKTQATTTFRKMFQGCSSITSIYFSWLDTSSAQSLQSLLEDCSNLSWVDFPNITNVTNINYMFKNCSSLTSINMSRFETANLKTMTQLFYGCKKLESIHDLDKISTANVTTMASMFEGCSSVRNLNLGSFNTAKVTDMSGMFNGCTGLVNLKIDNFNTAKVTNMNSMFKNCESLTTINVSGFQTSQVTSMASMFQGCKKLTSIDVSNFNTEKVTAMNLMFKYCESITSLDLKNFNTSAVKEFSDFVWGCKSLSKIDLSSFNTENATNMGHMFADCISMTRLNLNSFNTAKAQYVDNMFNGCAKLRKIYASDKFTTSAVINGADMFLGCAMLKGAKQCDGTNNVDATYANSTNGYFTDKAFEKPWAKYENGTLTFYCSEKETLGTDEYELNEGNDYPAWLDKRPETTKVVFDPSFEDAYPTSCYYWFYGYDNLNSIEGMQYLNTSEVTTMCKMFGNCKNIKSLDLSNFDTSKVTDMLYMFENCINLSFILASDKFTTKAVTNQSGMFSNCQKLAGAVLYPRANDDSQATFDGYLTNCAEKHAWARVKDDTLTFFYDTADDLDGLFRMNFGDNVPGWNSYDNISKVIFEPSFAEARPKTCAYWFSSKSNLSVIEGIENLNTSEVTNMAEMFTNCEKLTSLNLSTFDTSKVTDMYFMFYYCKNLTELNLSGFNTSEVQIMNYMFSCCYKLKKLDLSNFHTPKVENMSRMFGNCWQLEELDISNFNTTNTKYFTEMFYGCNRLNKLIISEFSTENLASSSKMFDSDFPATIYCSPNEASKSNSIFMGYSNKLIPYVSINSNAEYGTLCVPVGSTLAEDGFTGFDKLYTVKEHDEAEGKLILQEATSIEPGVPYVYHRNLTDTDPVANAITFTADMDAATIVTAPANDGSMLKGTFERITAPGGSYILQTDGMFHPVAQGNTTINVGAYRAYLDLGDSLNAKLFSLSFEDSETTDVKGISENVDGTAQNTYYDLMGRRVSRPVKGQVYIFGGKKAVY